MQPKESTATARSSTKRTAIERENATGVEPKEGEEDVAAKSWSRIYCVIGKAAAGDFTSNPTSGPRVAVGESWAAMVLEGAGSQKADFSVHLAKSAARSKSSRRTRRQREQLPAKWEGKCGKPGVGSEANDMSFKPRRTYLSFLNDLKPLIVIRIRFTHAQPQDAAPLKQDMVDRLFHRTGIRSWASAMLGCVELGHNCLPCQ
ncbi:unnamed protein product [Sphagnum jensenii]